jgi:uncharacterized tellurite resistance protein B-like protein
MWKDEDMEINTSAIRRLRDHLLTDPHTAPSHSCAGAVQAEAAVIRRLEPFAETMYLVMMADGEPAATERQALNAALAVLSDGQIRQAAIDSMLNGFQDRARNEGTEARLWQLGVHLSADRDDRETAFSLGAVMALADDQVDVRENQALRWVQEYFGLSDRRVSEILQSVD